MQKYILFLLLGLAVVSAMIYSQRRKAHFREITTKIAVRIPVLGQIIQFVYLARFSQVMSLLIASKVPMLQAVDMVQKMIGFYRLKSRWSRPKRTL